MAGEERAGGGRGGKLRLKRRRPPPPHGLAPPPPPPRRLRTLASSSSWFAKEGLSDAENTWMTLLRAVDPHLNHSSLEKVINLPEFCTKSSQIANPKPETFNTGMKQFQWIPFPLYRREDTKANDSRSHPNSENETVSLMERKNSEDERLGVISLVPKQAPLTTNEYTTEESRMSIKQSTKLGGRERIEMCWQNSPGHSPPTTGSHPKLWKGTSTQSEGESMRENESSENNDMLVVQPSSLWNEATSRLPAQEPPSASFSIHGQEKTEDHLPALDQCPMCQIHFTGTLSKLDIDSHLAKCLSESADDVIW